jgi:glycerol-3-phosphate dehydrogenase
VDRVAARLHELDGRPVAPRAPTDRQPLPGGEAAELEVLVEAARARGASEATARHLVAYYGSEAAAVLNLVDRDRPLGEPITRGRPEIWAEVIYAVERELAVRVQDILIRRLHLFYELPDQARSVVPGVAARMKQLLGWDEVKEAEELRDYFQVVERGRIKA